MGGGNARVSDGGFSGDDGETKTVAAEGHVIVETNYRVYAYTSSLVEMEILRLFTRADYRLPNLYVGMLTRESVQNALRAKKSALRAQNGPDGAGENGFFLANEKGCVAISKGQARGWHARFRSQARGWHQRSQSRDCYMRRQSCGYHLRS